MRFNRDIDKDIISPLFIACLVGLIILLPKIFNLYVDFLWFLSLGLESIFMTILKTKILLFLIFTIMALLFISANIYIAGVRDLRIYAIPILISLFVGFVMSNFWNEYLMFMNKTEFNIHDPIFAKDIAFYIFELPFYRIIQNFLFFIIFVSGVLILMIYAKNGGISLIRILRGDEFFNFHAIKPTSIIGINVSDRARFHLCALLGMFFLILSSRHFFDRYDVLYSTRGVVFGATYSDVNAVLPLLSASIFISLILAIMSFLLAISSKIRIIRINAKGLLIGIFIIYIIIILGLGLLPGLIREYRVLPNEFLLEREFIENNIEFTRYAYSLHNVQDIPMMPVENVSQEYIDENREIIDNIRLWDWRALKHTYEQMQEIRSYYDFNDVDIDRYKLNNTYTQVMLSVREINHEQLSREAKTWVNEHLVYTHGYGVCMSPVNSFTSEGLPEFLIKDIPPKSRFDELRVERPEIYYGEKTDNFVIVKTEIQEFDYPLGDKNKFTVYNGSGGIELNSFLRKLAMTIHLYDINIILSRYIRRDSRILLNRNINERVRRIAPFLLFDSDPYAVIANGKIYWIIDAYTYTNRYPYSTPYNREINYIRNSVKVIIDAYNGNLSFYAIDNNDPLIETYMKIFPGLFRKFDEMPNELKRHIRYPEGLFIVQARVYGIYHMTDPMVFYNKEDQWVIPEEVYGQGVRQEMEPYYIMTRPPGYDDLEFILMIPLTPKNKDNMIAWMVARCDFDRGYGDLIVYKFPKEKLIYGPMQIEARIDQDDEISQQLTLWSQRGSDVIRGNLLIIPIEDSLLYVEPLYIRAERATMPELKRVIVSYASRVVMGRNLDDAFEKLFSEIKVGRIEEKEHGRVEEMEERMDIEELVDLALKHYYNAREHIRNGNWSGYGLELENLEKTLLEMKNITKVK